MDVFDLSASLTLDSSEFEEKLNTAQKHGQTFGKSIGSALGKTAVAGVALFTTALVTGISVMSKGIKKTAEYGDKVDKMSQKIGISAESYQKWDYVMQRAGMNVDSLKTGMKTLSKQAESNSSAFQKLGISQEEVANLSQEELFERTVKGLSEMEAGTERTALATELLGRAGADMGPLLNQGSDAIEEQMEIAEKYGMVMSDDAVKASAEFQDSITTMQMTLTGLRNRMMGEFLPSLTQVTDGLALLFTGDMSGLESIEEGINGLVDKVASVFPKIIESGANIIVSLGMAITENLPQLATALTTVATTIVLSLTENLPAVMEAGVQTIFALTQSFIDALPQLIPAINQIILTIVDCIANNLPQIISAGVELLIALVKGLIKTIPTLVKSIPKVLSALVNGILGGLGQLLSAGGQLMNSLIRGIGNKISDIAQKAREIVTKVKDTIIEKASDLLSAGKDIVRGVWQGISDGLGWIKARIKEWVGNVKDFIKKLFGIKSPSKWARDVVGLNIAKGMALGIASGASEVDEAVQSLIPDVDLGETSVQGSMTHAFTASMSDSINSMMNELIPEFQNSMADALDGVEVKLNGRNFGRFTREVLNGGTI